MNVDILHQGLDAPLCISWEITYACNLGCVHCLSSSGQRHRDELSTTEAKDLIDQWANAGVFYLNIGGGEPLMRSDCFDLMDHSLKRGMGIKLSTNGTLLDHTAINWMATRTYFDLQLSLDGATEEVNDAIRGSGTFAKTMIAMEKLAMHDVPFKINTVLTRHNFSQLDRLHALAASFKARLRISRLRPTGRGSEVWENLRPSHAQNRQLYKWLLCHPEVLTGDSFFHLSAYGAPLGGLNLCGAGRIICAVNPVGDIHPCPFLLDDDFCAGNVRESGLFQDLWSEAEAFRRLRQSPSKSPCSPCDAHAICRGGCLAAKLAAHRRIDDPDPDCVFEMEDQAPVISQTSASRAHWAFDL
jgi:mycofactocin radical SAM maturase